MEQFHHGHHVRLRSRVHGTYLHADEDGHGVKLRTRRASMNAAWAVHLYQGQNEQFLLLHSAAYGSYLAATDAPAPRDHRGLRVEQRNYDHPEVEPIVWQAILSESEEEVYLRNVGGACLRANGRYWNTNASVDFVDDLDNISRKMLWVVEHIPAREVMPPLPRPAGLRLRQLPFRLIHFVWPLGVDVHAPLIDYGFFLFFGRSVFRLRIELARRLDADVANLVMCLRTGGDLLTPLLVDLPTNHDTLHIVVVITGTLAHAELRYPDVDAE
ncbi:hypothetical protein D1007_06653 [Hordeum vulgare]|nr:hypothetical protein D1007_06653 [Hordeum vulgare]